MDRKAYMQNYWRYYLVLEKRFLETADYTELDGHNFKTYSSIYAFLLQAIGSELDCFFKEFCGFLPNDSKTIVDYGQIILHSYQDITNQEIEIIGTNLTIKPFSGWIPEKTKQTLLWWKAFADIKHSRVLNMSEASQENSLLALGALFLLEMKLLSNITNGKAPDVPDKESALFSLKNWEFRYYPLPGGMCIVDGALCIEFDDENKPKE